MKQKTKLIIILAVEFIAISIVLLLIFFAGKKTYTVTFDINGGTLISGSSVQRVTQGQNASPPEVAKYGHYLMGWSGSYYKVTKDVTVKAIWEYETSPGIEYSDSENKNYCEIIGSHKEIRGDIYVGAYHDGKKVLGIEEAAFKDCKGITAIYLLDGILSIDKEAFAGCEKLETIDIPSTVISLGEGVFSGCKNLKSVVLPESLESIGEGAFAGCESLEEIIIPESVTYIGEGAFDTEGLTVTVFECPPELGRNFVDGWCAEGITVILEKDEEDAEDDGEPDDKDDDKGGNWWGIGS